MSVRAENGFKVAKSIPIDLKIGHTRLPQMNKRTTFDMAKNLPYFNTNF